MRETALRTPRSVKEGKEVEVLQVLGQRFPHALWKAPMLKRLMKNCSLWGGPMLENFVKECVPWEESHAGAAKGSKDEGIAETI